MRIENLPSPGLLSQGLVLRTTAAKALSAVETVAAMQGGTNTGALELAAFFQACVAAALAVTPADAAAPTMIVRLAHLTSPDVIRVIYDKTLDPASVPAPAAFTIANPARTVTKVEVAGNALHLTLNAPLAPADTGTTVAYNAPTNTVLNGGTRSVRGVQAATFTGGVVSRN